MLKETQFDDRGQFLINSITTEIVNVIEKHFHEMDDGKEYGQVIFNVVANVMVSFVDSARCGELEDRGLKLKLLEELYEASVQKLHSFWNQRDEGYLLPDEDHVIEGSAQ